jgi:DNA repair exonuclease SbcCD ATPase subunit
MKVIVRCANNRVTKTEMEREIERLFQENKDLRVYTGHLRDELNLSQQQSEARRQIICERDQRIQELEESLEKNTRLRETSITKMAEIQTNLYEQMREAVNAGAEINVELMEADATINEQKKRIEWLEEEIARLTNERDVAVNENTIMTFDINELRDKCEIERNLRIEAEKAYDQIASEAYDMHQQITNLTIDNTRLENQVEELEAEVDTCHHNIDGYIEGNRRMRAEYEKKMETEQDQTKYWCKKHDEVLQKMEDYKTQLIVANKENLARAKAMEQMQEEHNELEANFDELERVHKLWGEEIDRLRKVVTELQSTRFTTDEFIGMIMKNFMPSADK